MPVFDSRTFMFLVIIKLSHVALWILATYGLLLAVMHLHLVVLKVQRYPLKTDDLVYSPPLKPMKKKR